MSDSTNELMISCLAVIGFLFLIPIIALVPAYVLQHVWKWYAVAQFGMPPLKLSHCFLFTYAVHSLTHQSKEDKEQPWALIVGNVLEWAIFLGLAAWLR
jgi:hypothetical protein